MHLLIIYATFFQGSLLSRAAITHVIPKTNCLPMCAAALSLYYLFVRTNHLIFMALYMAVKECRLINNVFFVHTTANVLVVYDVLN